MEAEPIVLQDTTVVETAVQCVLVPLVISETHWFLAREENARDLKSALLTRLATLTIARYNSQIWQFYFVFSCIMKAVIALFKLEYSK